MSLLYKFTVNNVAVTLSIC